MAGMAGKLVDKVAIVVTTRMGIVPTLERGGIREARPLTVAPSLGRGPRMLTAFESSWHSPLSTPHKSRSWFCTVTSWEAPLLSQRILRSRIDETFASTTGIMGT